MSSRGLNWEGERADGADWASVMTGVKEIKEHAGISASDVLGEAWCRPLAVPGADLWQHMLKW